MSNSKPNYHGRDLNVIVNLHVYITNIQILTLCYATQLQTGIEISSIVVQGIADIHSSAVITLLDACFCYTYLIMDIRYYYSTKEVNKYQSKSSNLFVVSQCNSDSMINGHKFFVGITALC